MRRFDRGGDHGAVGRNVRLGHSGEGAGDGPGLPGFHVEAGQEIAALTALDAVQGGGVFYFDRLQQAQSARQPPPAPLFQVVLVEVGVVAEGMVMVGRRQVDLVFARREAEPVDRIHSE